MEERKSGLGADRGGLFFVMYLNVSMEPRKGRELILVLALREVERRLVMESCVSNHSSLAEDLYKHPATEKIQIVKG